MSSPGLVDPARDWTSRLEIAALVRAGRDGDRVLFDQLFEACFASIYALAWRATRDVRRAEAMTEEVLLEAVLDAS